MIEDRWQFVFVLEQALGHVVHAMNIERVLGEQADIDATIIPIAPDTSSGVRSLPLLRNWSLQSSLAARQALNGRIVADSPDAVFIHTQVAALLARGITRKFATVVSLDATPMNFDVVGEAYGHSRQADLIESAKRAVTRRALQGADAVVTWSHWAAESAVRDYGVDARRTHAIPPGVDLRRLRPDVGPREDGPVRILMVGADFERKGGLDLLDAMRVLDRPAELDIVSSSAEVPRGLPIRVHSGVAANSTLDHRSVPPRRCLRTALPRRLHAARRRGSARVRPTDRRHAGRRLARVGAARPQRIGGRAPGSSAARAGARRPHR